MIPTFIGFSAAFILGAVLAVVGGAGVELMECRPILSAFPAQEPACTSFWLMVFVGGLMTIIGGAVAFGVLAFGKLPDQR